jgi:hypothetical protein
VDDDGERIRFAGTIGDPNGRRVVVEKIDEELDWVPKEVKVDVDIDVDDKRKKQWVLDCPDATLGQQTLHLERATSTQKYTCTWSSIHCSDHEYRIEQ